MTVLIRLAFLALSALALGQPARAHEFWIEPQGWQVPAGTDIVADIRVGQDFKGPEYSYFPPNFARFELVMGETSTPVPGRLGDRPAMTMPAPAPGLAIIVHETTDKRLTYTEWETFVGFVTHKAFADALARHAARGLPETGFSETYRRYAKALVAVGGGAGADRRVGLDTEIVALANPYTDPLPGGLPVQVFLGDTPRAGAQLEVFDRAPDGTLTLTRQTLDAEGRADVPVRAGHTYLLDAVVLRDTGTDDPGQGAVWHSMWASLTFHLPD
ncbi:hypothetical protein Ga0609869_001528 [Rhodovulum iodosum]|uniref:DUF4198 domain-containing protein n=1 Tax=Rhodovulum iodosum TaxID=68291 RepID=A0ABV3XS72_9RHOB|nr:DUF4198 domain-containing protein [Rhodovulum robiginosum]RSK30508.1 DUF4198 domain-containing protein [Rhodovulum robiginosum]